MQGTGLSLQGGDRGMVEGSREARTYPMRHRPRGEGMRVIGVQREGFEQRAGGKIFLCRTTNVKTSGEKTLFTEKLKFF